MLPVFYCLGKYALYWITFVPTVWCSIGRRLRKEMMKSQKRNSRTVNKCPEEIPLTTVRSTLSGDTDTDEEGSPRHLPRLDNKRWKWHR